jgi:hypothetical protein
MVARRGVHCAGNLGEDVNFKIEDNNIRLMTGGWEPVRVIGMNDTDGVIWSSVSFKRVRSMAC